MDQQAVLGEETREEQPVPLFIRAVGGEQVDPCGGVAELVVLGAKGLAQSPVIIAQVRGWTLVKNAKRADRCARCLLGGLTAADARLLQFLAELGRKDGHYRITVSSGT